LTDPREIVAGDKLLPFVAYDSVRAGKPRVRREAGKSAGSFANMNKYTRHLHHNP
jgi:hypothetical protein